jgi:hypothetical protein
VEPNPLVCTPPRESPPHLTLIGVAELSERITKTLAESRRVINETQIVLRRGWDLLDRYRAVHAN